VDQSDYYQVEFLRIGASIEGRDTWLETCRRY